MQRAALAFALAACGPSEIEPQTPVNAQFIDPACVDAPAIEDGFPEALARSEALGRSRRAERPRSVSLGEIGDSPIGLEPNPPHRVPEWEQAFPCDWTNTCYAPRVFVWPGAVP
jgi:hypothetical protein